MSFIVVCRNHDLDFIYYQTGFSGLLPLDPLVGGGFDRTGVFPPLRPFFLLPMATLDTFSMRRTAAVASISQARVRNGNAVLLKPKTGGSGAEKSSFGYSVQS